MLSPYAVTYSPKNGGYCVIYRETFDVISRHKNKAEALKALKRVRELGEDNVN